MIIYLVTEEDCLGDGSVATSAGVTGQSWEGQRFPPSLIKPSSASPEKSPTKSPRKTTPKASPDPSPVKVCINVWLTVVFHIFLRIPPLRIW